ncbi:hypothetical protein OQA88_3327 [Cercophora sp. LCS_1]
MSGAGLEVLLEGLIPEIAYSGERGVSITLLLKIVRQYHRSLEPQNAGLQLSGDGGALGEDDGNIEKTLSEAEMRSLRWAWDWLRSRPQILINGNKRYNKLELSEVLALPEGPADAPADAPETQNNGESNAPTTTTTPVKKDKGKKARKALTVRPRIHPSEDLVWQTLTRHGVDYKRIPVLEWKCLLGIASVGNQGILQSDLRRLVDQDKRSLPKRTDSLAKKGYIAKRTVVANKMKTSKLWLIDFAPPVPEDEKAGLDLTKETLTKDLEAVPWHSRWTVDNVDVEAHAMTLIAIVKAWGVMRYCDLRSKMGVMGKASQMKTLAKSAQRWVDMGVLKYTAAAFPGSRKIFKDCLKYIREPRTEEWDKFLATGKKTSLYSDATRHRQPKANALAIYGKAGNNDGGSSKRATSVRIFPGWSPDKPISQNVFEVVKSAGPVGASNPQVSTATVGYSFRRYMASHLAKLADTEQPAHLKKFQVKSQLVRTGKTSAYMFSVPEPEPTQIAAPPAGDAADGAIAGKPANKYGFGDIRTKMLSKDGEKSISDLARAARNKNPAWRRKGRGLARLEQAHAQTSRDATADVGESTPAPEGGEQGTKRKFDEALGGQGDTTGGAAQASQAPQGPLPLAGPPGVFIMEPGSLHPRGRGRRKPKHSVVVMIRLQRLQDPTLLNAAHSMAGPSASGEQDAEAQDGTAAGDGMAEDEDGSTAAVGPRGRGRGGAKGKGKKGQAGGVKSYKCEKCGNTWKNDLGLKYHLTKAQTPCNPNFDPAALIERAAKRRRMSPVPPDSAVGSDAEGDGTGRSRVAKKAAKQKRSAKRRPASVRNGIRSRQDPVLAFRGFNPDDIGALLDAKPIPIMPRKEPAEAPERPATGVPSKQAYIPFSGQPNIFVPQPTYNAQSLLATPSTQHVNGTGADVLRATMPEAPQHPDTSMAEAQGYGDTAFDASYGPDNGYPADSRHQTSFTELSKTAQSGLDEMARVETAYPMPPGEQNGEPVSAEDATDSSIKPFQPEQDYDSIPSETKRRTAQAMDIIMYLLDNNNGMFPGDKAIFFALLKVFLQEFRGQYPPTWKNFHAAVKALYVRKFATVHTHMLRTERGKFLSCSLIIRNDVGPTSPLAIQLKQKMRDAYPSLYIPEAFSPSKEELAVLEQLGKRPDDPDKADKEGRKDDDGVKPNRNGPKFRTRRKIDEVEVFNAPFYTKGLNNHSRAPIEQYEDDNEVDQSFDDPYSNIDPMLMGTEGSRKRTVPDDFRTGPGIKRPKTYQYPDENDSSPQCRRETSSLEASFYYPPAFRRRKQTGTGQRRGPRTNSMMPGLSIMNVEPTSVADAVKMYGLLPQRYGKRKNRDEMGGARKIQKLDHQVGKIKNPGLSSLPESFFRHVPFVQPDIIPTKYQFLEPNTCLEDEANEWDEVSEASETRMAESPLTPAEQRDHSPAASQEGAKETEINFVPAEKLPESSQGSWASETLKHFEIGGSFELDGWMPTRAQLLLDNLPTSAEEMAKKNKGQPWRTDDWADQEWARFWVLVQRCQTWELSRHGMSIILYGGSVEPNYLWINVSPSTKKSNMKPLPELQWKDKHQFGVTTLPYDELRDDDDDDVLYPSRAPRRSAPKKSVEPRLLKRQRIAKVTEKAMGMVKANKFKLAAIKTGRELTSYPRSVKDFLRNPTEEVSDDIDWSSENVRLTAFVVVTTLLGGVDRVVDWGLMMRLFPELTISQLRHLWGALKKDRQSTIINLTEKFRRAFLKAYANDELPKLDFNNTLNYDWKSLIKWARRIDETQRENIPATRKEVDEQYMLGECRVENREWRESYYHMQRSVFNKFQDASSEAMAAPADTVVPTPPDINEIVALAWTRSLCVTPIDAYPSDLVVKRREKIVPGLARWQITELCMNAIQRLQQEGILSRSTSKWSNGRRWRFNNRVPDTLDKVAQANKLTQAVQFKRELDEAFRAGQKKRVTYVTNDGMMLALLNLQAMGRIHVETTGQKHVPMGHEPGNYETRKYTKKYLHFRLDISPTESYIYDDHPDLVAMRERLRAAEPPTFGPGGAIPVWCDVFNKVDKERWLKYLTAVLLTIASRGAMRSEELVKTLKPIIMGFEADLILDWAEKNQLMEVQIPGTAPAVREWWWLALEAQKQRLDEVKPRKMLPMGRRRDEEEDVDSDDDGF